MCLLNAGLQKHESFLLPGSLPESPPDSGSEHLLSPRGVGVSANPAGAGYLSPQSDSNTSSAGPGVHLSSPSHDALYQHSQTVPDLSTVDYSVPLQLIEQSGAKAEVGFQGGLIVQQVKLAHESQVNTP